MNQNNNYGNYQQDQNNNNNQGNYYQNGQGYNQVNYQNTGYNQTNPYQPQNFNAPQAPQTPPVLPGKGLGIAGFILGIVCFATCLFGFVSLVTGVLGLVFSIIAVNKAKAVGQKNGLAVAGIIISAVSLAIYVTVTFVAVALVKDIYNDIF